MTTAKEQPQAETCPSWCTTDHEAETRKEWARYEQFVREGILTDTAEHRAAREVDITLDLYSHMTASFGDEDAHGDLRPDGSQEWGWTAGRNLIEADNVGELAAGLREYANNLLALAAHLDEISEVI